jgi:uncharacterized protein YidB (DUF937 family)
MAGLGDLLGSLLGGARKSGGGGSGGGLDLGSVLGGLLGGGSGGSSVGSASLMTALLPIVLGMLAKGGLGKILSGFQAQGLSAEADSWVGKGPNKRVSADQVTKAVGSDQVAEIAKKLGVSQTKAAGALADLLPEVISHVTPKGKVPSSRHVDSELGKLREAAAA